MPDHNIQLIISDNDGCLLPESNTTIDPADLRPIAEHNKRALRGEAPPLVVCTGRPQPFVEFLMRVIHCTRWPCICESGVYLYSLEDNIARLDPNIKTDDLAAVRACREWLGREKGRIMQAGKEAQVTVFVPDDSKFESWLREIRERIEAEGWPMRAERTVHYINITLNHVSKRTAAERLLSKLGIDAARVLAIGDTNGDLVLRDLVGHFACPVNATDDVKKAADYVSEKPMIDGVVDILAHYV